MQILISLPISDFAVLTELVEECDVTTKALIEQKKLGEALEFVEFVLDRVRTFSRPENTYPLNDENPRIISINLVLPMYYQLLLVLQRPMEAYEIEKQVFVAEK